MIKSILNTDPEKRFKVKDIKAHSWYNQIKNVKDYTGILIGQNMIPVDTDILTKIISEHSFKETVEQATKMVLQNKHNALTTTYYLTLKRFIRQGGQSIADITKYNAKKVETIMQEKFLKEQNEKFMSQGSVRIATEISSESMTANQIRQVLGGGVHNMSQINPPNRQEREIIHSDLSTKRNDYVI